MREATEATVIYQRDQWLERGICKPDQTSQQWADAFKALGGEMCRPRPAWQTGAPAGVIAVHVRGADAAIRFVIDCCHPAAMKAAQP